MTDTASRGGDPAIRVRQRRRRLDTTPPRRPMSRSHRGQLRARPAARPRRTSQRRAEELEDPPQIRASPSRANSVVQAKPFSPWGADETGNGSYRGNSSSAKRSEVLCGHLDRYDWSRSRYPAAMVDPAGGSLALRYAGVTSTAVQPGAEFARVMSVIDVSTDRHRATDPAPRTVGCRDRVRPATRDGARRPVHGAEVESRRPVNPMLRARPQASARIEESVILVTV